MFNMHPVVGFLGFSVLHPALLWGALAVGLPILIHLLSRRRVKVRDWAAMEFLLAANRRKRRSIRLEQLILLLLRCLALLLLALLVARPVTRSVLAARLGAEAPAERVVLLDDSPSMSVQAGTSSVFERAKKELGAFVRDAAEARSRDAFTLAVSSRPRLPLVQGRYLGGRGGDEASGATEALAVSDQRAQYGEALDFLHAGLTRAGGPRNRHVYLLTDLRALEWSPADDEAGDGLFKRLAALRGGGDEVTVVDLAGDREASNLGVAGIEASERNVVRDVAVRYDVTVRNHAAAEAQQVEVAFAAQGSPPQRSVIPRIAPRETAVASFVLTAREEGPLCLTAELPTDDLAADNRFFWSAPVLPGMPVLLVDDAPAGDFTRSQSFYLRNALAPPGTTASGNLVETVDESAFEERDIEPCQAIFLCNVHRVSPQRANALTNWVSRGGGLVAFLGDQTDLEACNSLLGPDGAGLFPGRLVEAAGDPEKERWANLVVDAANHPVLEIYAGANNAFLQRVKLFRWWRMAVDTNLVRAGQATVLARVSGADASPVVVERRLGRGRVLVVATSPNAAWTSWPVDSSYVVVALEMARYAGRPTATDCRADMGAPLRVKVDPAVHALEVKVLTPGADSPVVVPALPRDDGMSAEFTETGKRGFYEVTLTPRQGGPEERRVFAVNGDPREGDLRRADRRAVAERLRPLGVRLADSLAEASAAASAEGPAKREVWRPLLALLLLVLAAEQALAWWFGYRR